ncbi:MAG: RNA polymerase sigma factor [Streptosporangiaceae bacterium]
MVRSQDPSKDAAASELFNAFYPRLAGWCRRLVDDTDTAHEIAAEAFVRLWSRWSRVDDPRGFLYVTATNLVRDHWRKAERERRAFGKVSTLVRTEPDRPPHADFGLRALVMSLPDRLRGPVVLHYYADMPIRDIALLLDRKEGTVKSDLHSARARLREALEGAQ